MALHEYFDVLRRRRWIIVATVVVCLIAAIAYTVVAPRLYKGTATVLISLTPSTGQAVVGGPTEQSSSPDRDLATQIGLVKSIPVAAAVINELGLRVTPAALLGQVSVGGDTSTSFVTIDFQDRDPVMAARIANAFATQYVKYSQEAKRASIRSAADQVQRSLDEALKRIAVLAGTKSSSATQAELQSAQASYNSLSDKVQQLRIREQLETGLGSIVSTGSPDPSPVSPNPARNVALGIAFGLLAGLGLAFGVDALDSRVKTSDEMVAAYDAPVLARIPKEELSNGESRRLTVVQSPGSPIAEAYRSLRNSIQFVNVDHAIKTLIVASAEPGEGKSTVAANLATVLSQAGWRVVLVVSDFRRPVTQEFFQVDDAVGLSNVLAGTKEIADAIQPVAGLANLRVLPAGAAPSNPSEMLGSKRMADVVATLRAEADWVIVDTAPILAVADAAATIRWADRVVMVGRLGVSRRDAIRKCREQLQQVGAKVLGVVVVEVEEGASARGYGGYSSSAN